MPQNANVLIAHGPYKACGILDHRKCRLEGMETALCKEGHTVEFEETPDWNCVELWVNGQCVYKCCVDDLDYGSDGELDVKVQEALKLVTNAY